MSKENKTNAWVRVLKPDRKHEAKKKREASIPIFEYKEDISSDAFCKLARKSFARSTKELSVCKLIYQTF